MIIVFILFVKELFHSKKIKFYVQMQMNIGLISLHTMQFGKCMDELKLKLSVWTTKHRHLFIGCSQLAKYGYCIIKTPLKLNVQIRFLIINTSDTIHCESNSQENVILL